jgi:stage II sporulation protein D (peptidoglycan lytic transglycosylase)
MIAALLVVACSLASCAGWRRGAASPEVPAVAIQPPWIRVGLAESVDAIELGLGGPMRVTCAQGVFALAAGTQLRARVATGAVILDSTGALLTDADRILLEPLADTTQTRFDGKAYLGRMEIRRVGDRVTLVNHVPLEAYLRGVVPWEIGAQPSDRLAAVEAQAIAARTYAYKRLGQHAEAGFDVYADVVDQVYQGATREDSVANRAIAATRGLVLTRGADLVDAYYSSTCGGHTARIESVWPKPAQSYLQGERDAPPAGGAFCAGSRHFRWSEAWSGAGLERTLQETLPPELGLPPDSTIGGLVDLRIATRDETGRVSVLEIQTTRCVYRVVGDRIRWVLRPRDRGLLRSTLFKLDIERSEGAIVRVVVRGGGNGHGVGMCQMGGLEMARRGLAVDAILAHYYPGTRILRLY